MLIFMTSVAAQERTRLATLTPVSVKSVRPKDVFVKLHLKNTVGASWHRQLAFKFGSRAIPTFHRSVYP